MTILLISALLAGSVGGWYSVMVPDFHRPDHDFLTGQGFDIEGIFGNRARIYVNDQGFLTLLRLGYSPVPLRPPEPLTPYPSLTEINQTLQSMVANHPDICRLETLGYSVQNRPIYAVVVTRNPSQNLPKPRIRIQACIHGDEKSSAMVALHFLSLLTENDGTSPMCTYLVDAAETWVIPVLNPDGYHSNSRYNANNVDLNRNLSYMWQSGGGAGPYPFSEPETRALRDITQPGWPGPDNLRNVFAGGLSGHSGATCVNTVWNYSVSTPIQDLDLVTAQAQAYAWHPSITGYYGPGTWDIWIPGASWYPITGDVNDWSYGECGTVDHTIEYSFIKAPSDWEGIAEANYMPTLEWAISVTYGVYGTVTDGQDQPLDALIEVSVSDGPDSSPLRFTRSDVLNGGYSKSLLPGTYDVTATVDGFGSQTHSGLVVQEEEMVELNFLFATGIEGEAPDIHGGHRLSVTPNPVRGSCSFTLPGPGLEGSLAVYDITGRLVHEVTTLPESRIHSWHPGGRVPPGVYIAVFTSGGQSASTRLVVAE